MCVHSTVMRQPSQEGHDRLIIHLYNDANTTAFHALPNEDVPLREETLPVHDIVLTIRPDYQITSAHFEPAGHDLPVDRTDSGYRIRVPNLDVHAMVVLELEP